MTNPGAYEQYPRPSAPAGPSSWQQPGFPQISPEDAPADVVAAAQELLPATPRPGALRTDAWAPPRAWALLAGVTGMLALLFAMSGTATQLWPLFGVAIASGFATVALGLKAAREAIPLLSGRPGSREDNR
jgi:hypothetical protein